MLTDDEKNCVERWRGHALGGGQISIAVAGALIAIIDRLTAPSAEPGPEVRTSRIICRYGGCLATAREHSEYCDDHRLQAPPAPAGDSEDDLLTFDIVALSAMIEVEIQKYPRTGDNVPKRGSVHKLIRDFVDKRLRTAPMAAGVDREKLTTWLETQPQFNKHGQAQAFADTLISSGAFVQQVPTQSQLISTIENNRHHGPVVMAKAILALCNPQGEKR
jgi:hypothetical protein